MIKKFVFGLKKMLNLFCLLGKSGVLKVMSSKKISWFKKVDLGLRMLFVSMILSVCNVIGMGVKDKKRGGINFNMVISVVKMVICIMFINFSM